MPTWDAARPKGNRPANEVDDTVSENFDLAPLANGGQLLLVTTVVEDPVYLNGPYVTSPHFKKEPDGSKWDPTPCSSTW